MPVDLKDDEEGPDHFSTLFTLPGPGMEPKQLELYDELLAIELHNRELRLMGTKTCDVQQEEPPPSYDKPETRLRLSPPPEKHHKPELDRLPDLKDDQEGPDNFSTLFTLPGPGMEPKQQELYDELLVIELHNRELRLMGTKTCDVQQEEPPPSYDKLETRLRLSPPPEQHHKPELDRLPDLKDDEEGPDNFSTLFTLPGPGMEPKQQELYDELLAIELHNRELRLMGTKTCDVQQEEPPPSYDKPESRLRLSPPPEKHHKPELDCLPDLKDDQEGADNLQLELYDELLAIELHNRELRLMDTKT